MQNHTDEHTDTNSGHIKSIKELMNLGDLIQSNFPPKVLLQLVDAHGHSWHDIIVAHFNLIDKLSKAKFILHVSDI